jgi:peptide/nickel transport system substrate-binding protein
MRFPREWPAWDEGGARGAARLTTRMLLLAVALAGCATGQPRSDRADGASAAPTEGRPLVIIVRVEPATLSTRPFQQPGTALHVSRRLFNALPALIDDKGQPRPQLLESLPQLNTDTWRVSPDGRMESTYRLKPGLKWHDGQPLTSDDFVFSWRLYATPEFGHASQPPLHAIDDVSATDSQTFVIRWNALYPDADTLSARDRELPPMPRHVLGPALDLLPTTGPEAVASHPFWTREYVGAGPYRLDRWEPGTFIDAVRYDGHVLGTPKIGRIILRFSVDGNVVMANLLTGDAHVATDNSVGQVAEAVAKEWAPTSAGSVIRWPNAWRSTAFQHRPEIVNPRAVLDPRVRKAIAHAIDKQAVSEAVYGDAAIFADTMIWSGSEWGAALDSSIATYPYDLRRTEALMTQAGFSKGSDGIYVGPDGRFSAEWATTEGPDNVPEVLIKADGLRRAGFDVREDVVPAAQAQDAQVRATFPAMQTSNTNMGEPAMINLVTEQIPSASNRWRGGNRGGWASPEYDRLVGVFNRTLDRGERVQLVRQLLRVYAEELPSISLFFRAQPFAHVAGLKGPGVAAPESSVPWNVHEWEFR